MNKAIVLGVALLLGPVPQANAAGGAASALDEWLEAAYGLNYSSPYTVTELRETSVYGWRVAAKVSALRWLSLVGSYDYQMYDTDDAFGVHKYRYRFAKYGVQTRVPLGDQFELTLQGTRQERYFDGSATDFFSGQYVTDQYAARGFGYLTGLRWLPSSAFEIDASYEGAPLEYRYGSNDFKETFATVDLSILVPLEPWLKLALTLEKASYTDRSDNIQFNQKNRNENILLGLRYAL